IASIPSLASAVIVQSGDTRSIILDKPLRIKGSSSTIIKLGIALSSFTQHQIRLGGWVFHIRQTHEDGCSFPLCTADQNAIRFSEDQSNSGSHIQDAYPHS